MKPKKNPSTTGNTTGDSASFSHEQITQRAHSLWLAEGKPEGRDLQHWLEAERQLRSGRGPAGSSNPGKPKSGESRSEIEADKRVDGLSPPDPNPRTPKSEQL